MDQWRAMRQAQFRERNESEWAELEHFLDALDKRSAELPFQAAQFPERYRRLCQNLSIARARGYSAALQEYLHALVLRAHQRLYAERRTSWRAVVRFLLFEYPRLVRAEWRYVVAGFALFMGPLIVLLGAVQIEPDLVYTLLEPGQVSSAEAMYDPQLHDRVGREREADTDFAMFGFYIRNNTSIGFQTFVGGIVFGIGTIFFLLFNGLYIGAIAGHLTYIGYTSTFWGFVSGHSAFELTAIALSGAAGLRIGMALLAPGSRTRRLALREAMGAGVRLMYGAAALFVAAAFVEAFWSSIVDTPLLMKVWVGIAAWIITAAYFLLPGPQCDAP
jgi:uncharacterized membrane protein SpoIIM required for sporulation